MSRKQAQITEALSIRLPKALHDRLFDVIRATDCEITRTDLVVQALETYLALLSVRPFTFGRLRQGKGRVSKTKFKTVIRKGNKHDRKHLDACYLSW